MLDIAPSSDVIVDGINGVTAGGGHGTGSKHPVNVGDHLKTIGTDRRDGTYV